jgi:hypothetical protein
MIQSAWAQDPNGPASVELRTAVTFVTGLVALPEEVCGVEWVSDLATDSLDWCC